VPDPDRQNHASDVAEWLAKDDAAKADAKATPPGHLVSDAAAAAVRDLDRDLAKVASGLTTAEAARDPSASDAVDLVVEVARLQRAYTTDIAQLRQERDEARAAHDDLQARIAGAVGILREALRSDGAGVMVRAEPEAIQRALVALGGEGGGAERSPTAVTP
jgi:hypothetical protein